MVRKRAATLDVLQSAYFLGVQDGFERQHAAEHAEIRYRRDLLYGALIQAGVDQIYSVPVANLEPTSTILQRRLRPVDHLSSWADVLLLISKTWEVHFGHLEPEDDRVQLKMFLVQVFAALHDRRALISLSGLPNLQSLTLPEDLEMKLRPLLQAIRPEQIDLPCIAQTLDNDAVARCEEVLASPFFARYEAAGLELDSSLVPAADALRHVQEAARRLVRKHSLILSTKRLPLVMLAPFLQVFSSLGEGLPAQFADLALKLLKQLSGLEQRIVVYDARRLLHQAYPSRPGA